jgi:hypothetical protein
VILEQTPIEPYPHAVKAKHLEDGIVKFPVNVHSLRIERSAVDGGYVQLIAKQNDICLRFVLDEEDCRYLATLLASPSTTPRAALTS